MGKLATVMVAVFFAVVASAQAQPLARLTIAKLGIVSRPIGVGNASLDSGPIFWPGVPGRPGQGGPIAIAGHNVTSVPGFGGHGPFYHIDKLRKGDRIKVAWKGKQYVYVVTSTQILPESEGYIVRNRGYENLLISTCWPRWTHESRLVVRAVLLKKQTL